MTTSFSLASSAVNVGLLRQPKLTKLQSTKSMHWIDCFASLAIIKNESISLKTAFHHGVHRGHGGRANIWRFSLNHLLGECSVFAKLLNDSVHSVYSVYSVVQVLFLGSMSARTQF